jgi:uncharacterized membrane protein YsdA (DUF1294 family)/cold shock CspA family protein
MGGEKKSGTIIEWKPKSPFGFADTGEERHFLHISNFVVRERWPENGDRVSYQMGVDGKGRPCAQQIVLHASGSVFRWGHLLELALLLALPTLAMALVPSDFYEYLGFWWIVFCAACTSALAGTLIWLDKRFSIIAHSRVPEATLHLFELCAGWPGSFISQRVMRHKISKKKYQIVFWSIVLIYQFLALDLLFGGFLYHGLLEINEKLPRAFETPTI